MKNSRALKTWQKRQLKERIKVAKLRLEIREGTLNAMQEFIGREISEQLREEITENVSKVYQKAIDDFGMDHERFRDHMKCFGIKL